jgi:hypothetical protein
MKIWSFIRRGNFPRSGLALTSEQTGLMLHHLEERVQGLEQELTDHRREIAEALRLGRRLQAQGDAHLWEKIEALIEEVETLRTEQVLLETPI